jgi:curved DNA-binding protein CbpA
MPDWTDLYAILGISRQATQAEIDHAYRTLLRRHHPDTRPPADESESAVSDSTLQRVLAAYTVLRDPVRRAEYDREIEVRPRTHPAPRPAVPVHHYRAYGRPPIVAGPVRWHRANGGAEGI